MIDRIRISRRHPLLTILLSLSSPTPTASTDNCNYCEGISNGYIQVPGSECSVFVQCANGAIGQTFNCAAGLIYDPSINQCNWATGVTCGPDYECPSEEPTPSPPTGEPTSGPTEFQYPPTESPVRERGGSRPGSSSSNVGYNSQATSQNSNPLPQQIDIDSAGPNNPFQQHHHAAIFTHLNANKININNHIFNRAKSEIGRAVYPSAFRKYSFSDFTNALRTMAEIGYIVPKDDEGNDVSYRNTFYLGEPTSIDAAAVGLINVAIFLSMGIADSFMYGSCDEVNTDEYNGYLPTSNSCGQGGLSYQDMHCSLSESHIECPLDYGMALKANPNPMGVTPFYCGSTELYQYTGVASEGTESEQTLEFPVQNREGRTDVQHCCWWGRGIIQTRGVCQYGKLNYYLGARAKEEGRDAILPHIDFCQAPQQICSKDPKNGNVEWIASLFRWIDSVQSYNDLQFSYIQGLNQFVMGGMKDASFIEAVSSIVTQGCHNPPCEGGTSVNTMDSSERWYNFQLVAQTLGLPVKAVQR
eukprot:scaffold7867_cov77-Cyclotella_meneghiniana.AAC.5